MFEKQASEGNMSWEEADSDVDADLLQDPFPKKHHSKKKEWNWDNYIREDLRERAKRRKANGIDPKKYEKLEKETNELIEEVTRMMKEKKKKTKQAPEVEATKEAEGKK